MLSYYDRWLVDTENLVMVYYDVHMVGYLVESASRVIASFR